MFIRFPQLLAIAGYRQSAGIATGMIVAVSIIPILIIQWKGRSWR